jgi:predicted transglutaminase-like cysteine proteinase
MLTRLLFAGKLGVWQFVLCMVFSGSAAQAGFELDRLLSLAGQRYGDSGTISVMAWRDVLNQTASQPEDIKLRRVNDFFNRRIRLGEDSNIWGTQDYWATPLEVLGRSQGDCEDFVIAKYASLKLLGIPTEKLRLTYVRARIGGPQRALVRAHMVLSYYPTPDDEPLVLDNLISDIRPASRRTDLTTIFGFNAEGLWIRGASPGAAGASQRLSKWQSVLARMREEGID